MRLEHAAFVSAVYLPGFRINEALSLTKSQFQWESSMDNDLFLVIEQAKVEKSGGRFRNYPIVPDEPLARPLLAHLNQVEDGLDFVFTSCERTFRNVLKRVTGDEAWPHWLREQRDTFLARDFATDERNRIFAWSESASFNQSRRRRRRMADLYDSMNWMSYADRLAKVTRNYWKHQQIPPLVRDWLDSLPPSLKAPELPAASP